ncbi:uncharacterized protein LOC134562686 [Prinia subflava]|uniref:uncharacterized protein LOC134562686 n=1 Tax=Prinia subflava TaxID=208062 RepID=UPI002FE3BF63
MASAAHPQPFFSSTCLPQTGQNEDSGAACRQIQIPVLGKLLGHLFFKLFRKEETSLMVLDILCSLFTFISKQKCATRPELHALPPAHWECEIISLLDTPSTWRVQAFGRFLRPAERTGVVLAAIEILGRSSLLDKKAPVEFLEVAMKPLELWLMDHLKKSEAIPIAVKVVHSLWRLFDVEEECVQESCICLFRDLLGKTVWRDKHIMKKHTWKALVCLLLHMSDQPPAWPRMLKVFLVLQALRKQGLSEMLAGD